MGLKYLLPDDDYVVEAAGSSPITITFGGTVDPDFPVENIGNEDPSNPFKTPDTDITIDIDLGFARVIGLIALVHTNIVPGSPATAEALIDDNSGFSSPSTVEIPIGDYQEDGQPANHILDFVAQAISPITDRYVRLHLTSAVGVTLGGVTIAAGWRELEAYWRADAEDDESHPVIENRSEGGGASSRYEHLYRPRWVRGDLMETSSTTQARVNEPLRRWNRACRGRGRPCLIDPELPIAEPWYVLFDGDTLPRRRSYEADDGSFVHTYQLRFEECPRGQAPEPSPL